MAKTTPRKKTGMTTRSGSNSKKNTPVNTPTKQKKGKKSTANDDSVLSQDRIEKAVTALTKYLNKKDDKKEDQLIDDDELTNSLNLIIVNNEPYSGNSKSFKSKLINVKHSLYKPWKEAGVTSIKDFKTLLILKDSDVKKVSEDDLHDKLNGAGITIDEIVCGKDLKTKYKAFESRRAFISEFSLILADDNIVTTLPKLLGGKASL